MRWYNLVALFVFDVFAVFKGVSPLVAYPEVMPSLLAPSIGWLVGAIIVNFAFILVIWLALKNEPRVG